MSDEFDIVHLDHESTQQVIDWAVSAAALVTLMQNSPAHGNTEEAMERLQGYIEAVEIMYNNIPEVIVAPAIMIANEAIDEAEYEQEQVEAFMKEIENL